MTIIYYDIDITEEGKLNRKERLATTETISKTFSLSGVFYDNIIKEGLLDKLFKECRLWGVEEVYVYYEGKDWPLKIEVKYD